MTDANKSWPPLIVAERVPRSVKWRDTLLTLIMWGMFAVLLEAEFAPVLRTLKKLGFTDFDVDIDWLLYLERLTPFLLMAAVLAGLLVLFSLQTIWRGSRSLLLPQPTPLDAAEQARRAGLDEAALLAAREKPVVVVHVNGSGFRIEPKERGSTSVAVSRGSAADGSA
jgi:poly-beta-1,6-N-acetyl-D-glucosamine biosynthesis protein PgaD